METGLLYSERFLQSLSDYFYLINRKYPERGALKLVGDRYKLESELRTILYRGVTSEWKANNRTHRLTDFPGHSLVIDGYNVLFTLLNYRLGRFVFISYDGITRDAGSLFGKIRKDKIFNECAGILCEFLANYNACNITFYLDAPVTSSIKHKEIISENICRYNLNGIVEIVQSADLVIKELANCTIATSDSALVDSCINNIIDIPRQIITKIYRSKLIDIRELLQLQNP